MKRAKSYKVHLREHLINSEEAAAYLTEALKDEDMRVFLLALKDVVEALGGMSWLAKETGLNRENLYRIFSLKGNPRFSSLLQLMETLGLELGVHPRRAQNATQPQKRRKMDQPTDIEQF